MSSLGPLNRPMLPRRARRVPLAERCEPRVLLAATLVADLYTAPASSDPKYIAEVGDTAFFSAISPGTGAELWKSDGTAAGTALVKDVSPGVFGSAPASLVDLNGTLLFTASTDLGRTRQLWRSDGTAAGTVPVTDAVDVDHEYTVQPNEVHLVVHDGAVYFRGRGKDGAGAELWRSDGTAAGTVRVKDIRPGSEGSLPVPIISSGGLLYFGANDGVHGHEIWATDGTEAGTRMLKDIGRLEQWPNAEAYAFAPAGGRMLFATSDPYVVGQPDLMSTIWSSDGTEQGTVRLLTVPSRRVQFAPLGDKVVILVEGRNAQQVLLSDGTAAGTVELKNFDAYFGMFDRPIAGDGVVYFLRFNQTDADGRFNELWKTDGTAAGTVRIDTLPPSPGFGQMKIVAGDRLYLTVKDEEHGRELWSSDGSPGGARMVEDIRPGPEWSDPQEFAEVGGVAFFSADDGRTGRELWRSDGTAAGTDLVKDINPATLGSNPHHLADAGGMLFAATDQNDWGTHLVRTDVTGKEVVPVVPAAAIPGRDGVVEVTGSGDLAYFITYTHRPFGEWHLNRTDGTSEGTIHLKDFEPAVSVVDLDHNGTVVFGGARGPGGWELWRSDGTPAGTVLVKDINPGGESRANPFAMLNGVVLLNADDGVHGAELWRSDGTAAGTVLVKDIVPGAGHSDPKPVAVAGGVAYFRVYPAPGVVELWKSDGTEAGTARVAAVGDGPYPIGYPLWREAPIGAAAGNAVVFSAYDAERKLSLWRSDGTEAGTLQIDPAPGTLLPASFASYAGKAYFAGTDPEAGRELWSSDGTAAGTRREADVWPGPVGSAPEWLAVSGGALWFGADSAPHGRELWKFVPDEPTVVARKVFYNNSAFDGRDPGANLADLGAVAWDKEAMLTLSGSRSLRPVHLTSFDKGINGVLLQFAGGTTVPQLGPEDLQFRVGTGDNTGAWTPAPAPSAIVPVPGNGEPTFLITWPDGAIKNTWLRVGIRANGHTGLTGSDIFYFGNLVGDATGNGRVDALDLAMTRRALNTDAAATSAADFNRDGRVNALDLAIVKRNLNASLTPPTPPGPPPAPPLGPTGFSAQTGAMELLDERRGIERGEFL